MNSFISYLKNPFYCESGKLSAIRFIALYFIYYAGAIAIGFVITIVSNALHLGHYNPGWSPLKTILLAVLLGPFYEEVIFRSLLRFKWNNILLFSTTAIAMAAFSIYKLKFVMAISLSVLVLGLLLLVTIFTRNKVELFIASKFKYFFYGSSILFGLIHASNFTGNIYYILAFSFILGGPQIVLGLINGYLRMNHGLKYSILFHMAVNLPIIVPVILHIKW